MKVTYTLPDYTEESITEMRKVFRQEGVDHIDCNSTTLSLLQGANALDPIVKHAPSIKFTIMNKLPDNTVRYMQY